MQKAAIQRLLSINQEFYQSFGHAFAETRRRIQPGVARALEEYISDGDWLDLGCGSSALSQAWTRRGLRGSYTGLDFSAALLEEARLQPGHMENSDGLRISFLQRNLLEANWRDGFQDAQFDGVVAFAVLHHIPGSEVRTRLLQQVWRLIKPGGLFIHSEWQFQNSPKLMARVQPWSLAGVDETALEPGDTLLDWRHQGASALKGHGLRYVHLFDREELRQLASAAGFEIIAEFTSDGAGEKLGLYQVWKQQAG